MLKQNLNLIKKELKKIKARDIKIKINYHYFSGFFKVNDNIFYLSCFDERYNPKYMDNILIRTAESFKDFSGGKNNFSNIENLNKTIKSLEVKK